jgi:hypothetical protein
MHHATRTLRALLASSALGVLACTLPATAATAPHHTEHTPRGRPLLSLLPPAQEMPNASAGLARTYSGTKVDVTTYHYDLNRTGWNPTETDLTVASVSGGKFGLLKTLNVDGNVFAQPLLVSNFVMPDNSKHDVLIIATGHNSVYAYDAQTYAVLWHVNLGTSQSSNDVGCGDVKPEYGISSTPVILRTAPNAATLYLVAATEPTQFVFQSTLHALNLATGADTLTPVVINPSATLSDGSTLNFDPQNQWNRAGLAMHNGQIYIGIGSHCDNNAGNISGWLLDYGTDLTMKAAFHTIETPGSTELASIWMTGFAPAIDSDGYVYVVTGNGALKAPTKMDWGESVLRLRPELGAVVSHFTPATYAGLNSNDTDFGSGGVMLLPPVKGQTGPELAVAAGKEATLYLMNQTALGGLKPHNAGVLQSISLASPGGGVWGGPAYFNGPAGPTVYLQINGDVMRAFGVTTGTTPSLTQSATGSSSAGYGGSLPIISSNAASAGTGVLWLIRRSIPMELEAYDAVNLGNPLYAAQSGTWSNPGQANPFVTPMEANGRVYAPAYKTVKVFGLTP